MASPLGEAVAVGEVGEVGGVGVGFAFVGDVVIGFEGVASVLDQAQKPFYDICYVEWEIQQLSHLGGMDLLVVDDFRRQPHVPFDEENAEQVDGAEFFTNRDDGVSDDHNY